MHHSHGIYMTALTDKGFMSFLFIVDFCEAKDEGVIRKIIPPDLMGHASPQAFQSTFSCFSF